MSGSKFVHLLDSRPVMLISSLSVILQNKTLVLPNHIPKFGQFGFVRRIKSELGFGVYQDSVLELAAPEHDGRLHMGILYKSRFYEKISR